MKLLPIKDNSDITIISCLYYEQFKHKNSYKDDVFIIVFRDATDTKQVEFIPRPTIEIYFAKEEFRDYITPRMYFSKDKTYSIECRHAFVLDAIAKEVKKDSSDVGKNFKKILNRYYDTRQFSLKKELHKYPYTFYTDMDIESRYRQLLGSTYNTMRNHNIRKCFLDIESDMYNDEGQRFTVNEYEVRGINPINMITIMFMYNPKTQKADGKIHSYTFAVKKYDKYKGQKKFFSDVEGIYEACNKEISDLEITVKNKKKNFLKEIGMKMKFNHVPCESEEEMLLKFWQLFHAASPDTCGVWNIAYDIPKIHDRLEMLGHNPVDIMSHPGFPEEIRFIDMNIDDRAGIEMCNRNTRIQITNTCTNIDQMILYAAVLKGRKDYGSNSLDNIAQVEAGITKKKFSDPGVDVMNAPMLAYREFYIYSIVDVIIQVVIEFLVGHIENLMFEVNMTATAPHKINKLNTYLRNVYYDYYIKEGYIPGNNKNTDYARNRSADDHQDRIESIKEDIDEDISEDEKISKAIHIVESDFCDSPFKDHELKAGVVADPNLNKSVGIELFKGHHSSHIFPDSMDEDYTAHYPNATIVYNISDVTQFGRLVIKEKISNRQNPYNESKYVPGGEFMSDLISEDMISVGNVWFGLGTSLDLIKELDEMED